MDFWVQSYREIQKGNLDADLKIALADMMFFAQLWLKAQQYAIHPSNHV
jgi:hypothetical protein